MATKGGPNIITDGLVLALDAANTKSYPGSGTTWFELSGNGNHGTLINSPTYNGGFFTFDGVNDYCNVPNDSSLQITEDLTLSFTFNPTDFTSPVRQSIIFKHYNTEYEIIMNNNGSFTFYNGDGNWEHALIADVNTISTGSWHEVSLVRTHTGKSTKLYANGNLKKSANYTKTVVTGSDDVKIGVRANVYYFNGGLSNVKIYNKALSAEEVLQNYNATKSRFI
jgi:hypothetical protein